MMNKILSTLKGGQRKKEAFNKGISGIKSQIGEYEKLLASSKKKELGIKDAVKVARKEYELPKGSLPKDFDENSFAAACKIEEHKKDIQYYDSKLKTKFDAKLLTYFGSVSNTRRSAVIRNLFDYGSIRDVTKILVVADDFSKQGRIDSSYVLLQKAFEDSSRLRLSKEKAISNEGAKKLYSAIGTRAARYARSAAEKKDRELAEDLLDLTEDCSIAYQKLKGTKDERMDKNIKGAKDVMGRLEKKLMREEKPRKANLVRQAREKYEVPAGRYKEPDDFVDRQIFIGGSEKEKADVEDVRQGDASYHDVKTGKKVQARLVSYRGLASGKWRSAAVKEFLGMGSLKETSEKLVVADDYAKHGRLGESYAILHNAFSAFEDKSAKGEDRKKMYSAIGTRAARCAQKAFDKQDNELAKDFYELAKDCKLLTRIAGNMRWRLKDLVKTYK